MVEFTAKNRKERVLLYRPSEKKTNANTVENAGCVETTLADTGFRGAEWCLMVPKARKLSLWWQAENGLAPTGRAQLQLATAPQGRTPVLGVSGSGHMDEGGFEEPILHAETKAKIPGPPELSRADLARQKGPSTVWPLPETLNTFGRDCAQQNLDDGEGPVLGRQPASQEEDT